MSMFSYAYTFSDWDVWMNFAFSVNVVTCVIFNFDSKLSSFLIYSLILRHEPLRVLKGKKTTRLKNTPLYEIYDSVRDNVLFLGMCITCINHPIF